MSAYIVNRSHIRALVDFGLRPRYRCHGGLSWVFDIDRDGPGSYTRRELPLADWERAAEVGQMLWDENIASVSHRYPGNRDDLPGPVGDSLEYGAHVTPLRKLSPVEVLKALSGYEYQSCEHPGWLASEAKAFCDALRSRAICDLDGYDDAAWAIE